MAGHHRLKGGVGLRGARFAVGNGGPALARRTTTKFARSICGRRECEYSARRVPDCPFRHVGQATTVCTDGISALASDGGALLLGGRWVPQTAAMGGPQLSGSMTDGSARHRGAMMIKLTSGFAITRLHFSADVGRCPSVLRCSSRSARRRLPPNGRRRRLPACEVCSHAPCPSRISHGERHLATGDPQQNLPKVAMP